jgi:MFS family permease
MPPAGSPDASTGAAASIPDAPRSAYDAPFWYTYAANLSTMLAFSLLFRYSDFVHLLGGTEFHLGLIVGIGMAGSVLMRFVQGVGVDRLGAKQVWLVSNAIFILCLLAHLLVDDAHSPAIYALRIVYQASLAGIFGASITYISRTAPLARVAEVVGTLGTSGFVGMMAGTTLGDWLCRSHRPERWEIDRLFLVAAGMGLSALVFALLATRGQMRPVRRRQPPFWRLIRRYHPGIVLAMGVATGFGIGLPQVFLRPYVADLGFAGIAVFFWAYTILAFFTRLCIRQVPEKFGVRPMISVGLVSLSISMLLYLVVRQPWQLVIPAVFTAIAHALLFPAIVAQGSTAFPVRFRGLGVATMLATVDLGNLVGGPIVGGILRICRRLHVADYPTMFVAVSAMLATAGAVYIWQTRGQSRRDPQVRHRRRKRRRVALARVRPRVAVPQTRRSA